MGLGYARVVTAPDGRVWTVERQVLPPRSHSPRPYPHEIDGDRNWSWSAAYWIAPSAVLTVFLFRVAIVPAISALLLAIIGWVSALNGLRRRMRGHAPWKVIASTPPTEFEHGTQLAWAVIGRDSSERAVNNCADAIHHGTPPDVLNPGPPLTVHD